MRRRLILSFVVVLLGTFALVVAGCGGEETVAPTAETVVGGETGADTGGDTGADTGGDTGADTGGDTGADTGGDTDTGGAGEGDAAAGAAIFTAQGCGGCHVLQAAGSSGSIGPNLDESKPDFELVVERVTNGSGAMPSFSDKLSEEEIKNVAAYVVESTQ